jgi:hypothetical protein
MAWSSKKSTLTWKLKDTKCKRSYFQLQVSVPRTKDTESGSWLDVEIQNGEVKLVGMNFEGLLPTPRANQVSPALSEKLALRNKSNLEETISKLYIYPEKNGHIIPPRTDGKDFHLNPQFVEEMMGYPVGWTDLED